jgi:hypothetical protein
MKVETAYAAVDGPYRERLAAWLREHGIDPDEVPVGADISVNLFTFRVTVEVFARDPETGKIRHTDDRFETKTVVVPLRMMPPKSTRR